MTSEPKYLAVVDAGHGETYAITYDLAKRKRSESSFPTVRAMTAGETLGLGKDQEHTTKWTEWNGVKYNMGFEALLNRNNLEVHEGANRYGNEFHAHMVAAALAEAGLKSTTVDLVVFCPPKMYHNPTIKQRIEDTFAIGNSLEIKVRGDKQPRVYEITRLTIRVEGLMSAFALVSDEKGHLVTNDLMNSMLIADLGNKTADFAEIVSGRYNLTDLEIATFDKAGIGDRLLSPLLKDLKKAESSFDALTTTDLDRFIRCATNGYIVIDYAGFNNNDEMTRYVTERYHFWRRNYAEYITNRILDSEFDGMRKFAHTLMIGGGYHLAGDMFRSIYGDKILDTSTIPNVKNILPWQWNAEAAMRAALGNARKKGLIV